MNDYHAGDACPDREPDLERYLFDELEPEARIALERHLQECAGCRSALADARRGFSALQELAVAPAPYAEGSEVGAGDSRAEAAWREFLRRNRLAGFRGLRDTGDGIGEKPEAPGGAWRPLSRLRPVAAAALILIGLGIGRWLLPNHAPRAFEPIPGPAGEAAGLSVEAEAIDELARAELLADLGISWVEGVLGLVRSLAELDPAETGEAEIERMRVGARRLIQDGRLLTGRLDRERDAVFMAAIDRAEFVLEDIAGLGGGAEVDWGLDQIRSTLAMTGLGDRLTALDMNAAVTEALAASGWIGEEYRTEMQLREVRR